MKPVLIGPAMLIGLAMSTSAASRGPSPSESGPQLRRAQIGTIAVAACTEHASEPTHCLELYASEHASRSDGSAYTTLSLYQYRADEGDGRFGFRFIDCTYPNADVMRTTPTGASIEATLAPADCTVVGYLQDGAGNQTPWPVTGERVSASIRDANYTLRTSGVEEYRHPRTNAVVYRERCHFWRGEDGDGAVVLGDVMFAAQYNPDQNTFSHTRCGTAGNAP